MIYPSDQEEWASPLCPQAGSSLDWEGLVDRFEWLGDLRGVAQNPHYHAEGDVFVHTHMVMESLVSLSEWQDLSEPDRSILFLSALMHDIAKPICTKIEEDGTITSHHHAQKGALMARRILWEGLPEPVPFFCREKIAHLVRYHGLPLWFMEKANPEKEIFRVSQFLRLDHLALLAEADVRGRICQDQEKLLNRIELFRMFCREEGCLETPLPFFSNHTRFLYFNQKDFHPSSEIYDTTKFEVLLMSGLPGAGKDTWINTEGPGYPVVSLDQIRDEMDFPPTGNQGPVVQVAKERAREYMRKEQPFIWNATSLIKSLRTPLIDFFSSYSAKIKIVYREASFAKIFQENQNRPKVVPEEAIEWMSQRMEIPDLTEAHEMEWVVK